MPGQFIPYHCLLSFILLLLVGCTTAEESIHIESSVDPASIAILEIDYKATNLEIKRVIASGKKSQTIFLQHFNVVQKVSDDNNEKVGGFAFFPSQLTPGTHWFRYTPFPFQLNPGKYWIRYTLIYGGHRISDFERNPKYHPSESGFVTLKAGHRYKLKRKSCLFCRSASKSTSWIEDVDTGEVILGSSDMNRSPREDCDKYDPDPLIVCPWWGMNIQRE